MLSVHSCAMLYWFAQTDLNACGFLWSEMAPSPKATWYYCGNSRVCHNQSSFLASPPSVWSLN